jgi:hypothetical protein
MTTFAPKTYQSQVLDSVEAALAAGKRGGRVSRFGLDLRRRHRG